jgi:HD-like signal output (HDOD) protein
MLKLFSKRRIDPRAELKALLGNYDLPTFPVIAQQVMQMVRDPNVSGTDVARLIEKDPGLSAGVLKTVNSAAFSPRKHVDNLNQAVAMLGLSPLESLVLSTTVGKLIPKSTSSHFSSKAFWLTSARRAAVARSLASQMHPATINLTYTASLLQDMAVPFLIHHKPEEYGEILDAWRRGDGELCEMERDRFGWDHAEVATWICSEWGFPDSLTAAIGGHHGVEYEGFEVPPAVMLVSLIRDDLNNPGTDQLIEAAHMRYGMDPARAEELLKTGFEAADELAGLFLR